MPAVAAAAVAAADAAVLAAAGRGRQSGCLTGGGRGPPTPKDTAVAVKATRPSKQELPSLRAEPNTFNCISFFFTLLEPAL